MQRWLIMVGCGLGLALSVGPVFWLTFGLFLPSVTKEFGWSRSEFAFAYSAASIVNALILPIGGYFVDRYGPKLIILIGLIGFTAAYASFSQIDSYFAFIAVACLVAGFGCLASYPSYLGIIPRWFDRNLGLALALSASGVGIGQALFPYLIRYGIESSGWRNAFILTAATALVLGLVNFFTLVKVNKGALPEQERRTEADAKPTESVTAKEAVRTKDFWLFSVGFSLIFMVTLGTNFHFGAMISDRGGSGAQAAAAVATLGGASLVARFVTGYFLDRFPLPLVATVFFVGQALGCLLLLSGGLSVILPAAVLLGLAQGAELDMLPYVIARRFGMKAYSQIYGSSYAVLAVGQIIAPLLLSWIFDWSASYTIGFAIFAGLSLTGLAFVVAGRPVNGNRASSPNEHDPGPAQFILGDQK